MNRRKFLAGGLAGGLGGGAFLTNAYGQSDRVESRYARLDEALARPVFKQELFKDPVIVESVELLKKDRSYLCRVRSTDGAEGISVAHNTISVLYPIFVNRLQRFFVGQDARRMDRLVEKALEFAFNFRLGGLGIGIPLATVEFALLDMLGRIAGKPVGQLLGEIHNTHIPVYQATEWREKPVEESVALIKAAVEKSGAPAVKIKVGALMFMTKDLDARGPAGRTEAIIPLIRETFGPDMALYADANGYYRDPQRKPSAWVRCCSNMTTAILKNLSTSTGWTAPRKWRMPFPFPSRVGSSNTACIPSAGCWPMTASTWCSPTTTTSAD